MDWIDFLGVQQPQQITLAVCQSTINLLMDEHVSFLFFIFFFFSISHNPLFLNKSLTLNLILIHLIDNMHKNILHICIDVNDKTREE